MNISRKCWIFETQVLEILEDNDNTPLPLPEEIIGGDVTNSKHLF